MKKLILIPLLIATGALFALWYKTHDMSYLYQAITLSLIEISMSFDNAVANERKLRNMSNFWREMFFWVGLPIAVVGMRFYIPLEIVAQIEGIGVNDAYHMAMTNSVHFAETLTSAHQAIAGFGGAFLLLTALEFFTGDEKEHVWIPGEEILSKIGVIKGLEFVAVFAATLLAYVETHSVPLVLASLAGCITFVAMGALKQGMEHVDGWLGASGSSVARVLSGGLGGFLYLEVLDASFSLDGVVAAFAISKNIWVVAVGLGIGAAFVRELTLWMLKSGLTASLKFLPNGAFFSILALSLSMYYTAAHELPEWLIAAMSVGFIVAAGVSSLVSNRNAVATQGA
jgi:hypothetical protein